MLSSRKKDKKYRAVVQKFEIRRLQAKVFSQDLSLKNQLSFTDKKRERSFSTSSSKRKTFYSFLQPPILFTEIPRNSSKTRVKNRCIESGRSRSVLRFCKLSRILLREKASRGAIPGVVKASW